MKYINVLDVPHYVQEEFNRPQSDLINADRVHKLINEALKNIKQIDWRVDGTKYQSNVINEPTGMEKFENNFIIYGEERGTKHAIAVFHCPHMAAEYFVWLVSRGNAQIDWTLFLEK